MKDLLPFLIIGLTTGSAYALASMGLVLTYTTSGIFNFAHGAVAMAVTFGFYSLRVDLHWPTPLAAAAALLVVAPLFAVVLDRLLFRGLDHSATTTIVMSIGLLVALQGIVVRLYGGEERRLAPLFPTRTYSLPGVNVGIDQTVVVVVAAACGLLLAAFFRRTHLGLEMRAVVGDRELAELVGTDGRTVTTLSWILGCSFAALSGILLAPIVGLDSVLLTLLVVQAFGAAIVGGLRSLSGAYGAALAIAAGAALSTKWVATVHWLSGLPASLPFLVLFAVLVLSRRGTFNDVETGRPAPAARTSRRRRLPLALLAILIAGASLLPAVTSERRLFILTTTVCYVLLFESLSVLVGMSAQVSLCHAVFVLFGSTTLSHLLAARWPFGVALLVSAAAMVPVGALLALPAVRLSRLFLALSTFGFGILAQNLLFPTSVAFGQDGIAELRRPGLFRSDLRYYYLALALVVVGVLVVELARATRLGRIARALGDAPAAVQSLGIEPTAVRVLVFCLSAFLAALAGGLLGALVGSVNASSFTFSQSLVWVAVLAVTGPTTLAGAVVAAVLFVAVPSLSTSAVVTEWQPVIFGVAAIALARQPHGLVGLVRAPDIGALAARSSHRRDRRRMEERYAWAGERIGLGRS
jgi:branched-subunit amino acid ABC-type transport system permease component